MTSPRHVKLEVKACPVGISRASKYKYATFHAKKISSFNLKIKKGD
jgi:hypothetical protein